MATVPVTGEIRTATGRKDSRSWTAFSPVYREGANGEVITTRGKEFPVHVAAGHFSAQLEPGICVIENPDGQQYTVTVPDEAADLWELIATAVAFPPDTSAEALADAVTTYLDENPVVEMAVDGLTDAGTPGKNALKASTQTLARAAIDAAGVKDAYKVLARNPDGLIAGAVTRNSDGAATSASVVWPDGTPGTYNATALSSAFPGAVDAYTITYGSPVTATYTQAAVTRDSTTGAVTSVPAITVS